MSRAREVLVFDSGVGGLSVLGAVAERLPGVRLTYACDNAAFPYGSKPEDALVARVDAVLTTLVERFAPDLLVVACNTASTVALPRLRDRLALPVVGTVPAIKPAVALSRRRVIGLLATPGTVGRAYTRDLIREFAGDCEVVSVGSSELVHLAEAKLRGEAVPQDRLQEILRPFFDRPPARQPDVIVLGCTHFPLLRDELQGAAPAEVAWIDSAEAIAKRVEALLAPIDAAAAPRALPHRAVFTAERADVAALAVALRTFGCGETMYL